MPCLSGRYDPRVGPIVNVGVTTPGAFAPGKAAPGVNTFPALIDTGASTTCISLAVAQATGLQAIGLRPMISATHSVPVSVYLADLVMPFGGAGFVVRGIQLMEFTPHASTPFQILLGRDILCEGSLTMRFDGHFTLCL